MSPMRAPGNADKEESRRTRSEPRRSIPGLLEGKTTYQVREGTRSLGQLLTLSQLPVAILCMYSMYFKSYAKDGCMMRIEKRRNLFQTRPDLFCICNIIIILTSMKIRN